MQDGSSPTEIKNSLRSILSVADGPCTASFLSFQLPGISFEKMESALLDMVRDGELQMGAEGISLILPIQADLARETNEDAIVASGNKNDDEDLPMKDEGANHLNFFDGMSDQSIEDYFAQLFNESSPTRQGESGSASSVSSASDVHGLSERAVITAENEPSERTLFLFTAPVSMQEIPSRLAKYAEGHKKRTWGQLIECDLRSIPGVGALTLLELEAYLSRHALGKNSLPGWAKSSVKQIGETRFFFDQIGILCSVLQDQPDSLHTDPPAPIELSEMKSMPIACLELRKPTERVLRANGITTVGEVITLGTSGLLSLRSFGLVKLGEVFDAIDMLRAGAASLRAGEHDSHVNLQHNEIKDTALQDDGLRAGAVRAVLDALHDMQIPYYRPSMEGWLRSCEDSRLQSDAFDEPFVMQLLASEGLDEEAAIACTSELTQWAQALEQGGFGDNNRSRCYPKNKIWIDAVHSVFDESEQFEIDDTLQTVTYHPISLEDWLRQIEATDRDSNMLRLRIEGYTLQEVGDAYGLTRERARQLVGATLRRLPAFDEDRFLFLMQNYQVSQEEFCEITGCSPKAYRYIMLHSFKKRDRRPLSDAAHDAGLPEELKKAVHDYLHDRKLSHMVDVDSEYVFMDRLSLVKCVLSRMTASGDRNVATEELYRAYEAFLIQYGLERQPGLLPKNSRALFSWMQRQRCFMAPRSSAVRVYDFDLFDFSELENLWSDLSGRNIECSTALVYRDNRALMESLDIRDEYELHWVSETLYQDVLEGVTFGPRMPMVTLGRAERHAQILSLMTELSPVSTSKLAAEYERLYGVAQTTFAASFLGEFSQYKVGNGYEIGRKNLSIEELDFLHDELGGAEYRSLEFIRGRFVGAFPDESSSVISDSALRELAARCVDDDYVISEGLIVRSDLDLSDTFRDLIRGCDFFSEGDEGFGHDVFVHSAFRAELNKALRAFDIVRCMQGAYYSAKEIERRFGIKKSDIKGYLDSVLAFVEEDTPFTIYSLRKQGFLHVAELLSEGEQFGEAPLEGILASGSGSKRLSTSSMCGKMIFCKTEKPFSTVSLLEAIVRREGELEVDELIDVLMDEYDIPAFPSYVRQAVQRTSLVYMPVLDMVFCTAEDYRAYVERYLG